MTIPFGPTTNFAAFLDVQDARIADQADLFVKAVIQTVFNEVQVGGRYSPGTPIADPSLWIHPRPHVGGFLRSNWRGGIGAEPQFSDGAGGDLASTAAAAVAGDTVYMSNNAPYARAIEFGHSTQAPQGMVRLALDAAPLIAEEVAQHLAGTG